MKNNVDLPLKFINKILMMRPSYPTVKTSSEYVYNERLFCETDNYLDCHNVYWYLQNNDRFMMEHFNYKYKNYVMIKNFIKRFIEEIKEYQYYSESCKMNYFNDEEHSFKAYQNELYGIDI